MNFSFNSGLGQLVNPKVRRKKFGISSLIFLVLFGLAFFTAGHALQKAGHPDPTWTKTTGVVVGASKNNDGGSTTYASIVEYTVDGMKHRITSSSSSSAYPQIGATVEVAYNPTQPDNAKIKNGTVNNLFIYAAMGIGLVCFAIGPFLFFRSFRRTHAIKTLEQTGHKLQGVITNIQGSSNSSSNNGSYHIVVSADDGSGTVHEYVSDSLVGLGGIAMVDFQAHPVPIDVFVNPSNPKDYYVDLSDVPSLTPDRIKELIQSSINTIPPDTPVIGGFAPTPTPTPTPQPHNPEHHQ